MKKLLLLLTIISHFAFGQAARTKQDAPKKITYLQTGNASSGSVPFTNIVEYTDTLSGKSPIWQFDTPRIKYKNQRIETDTSKFDKVNVGKGDSAFWVSKKLISGSGAIDTLKTFLAAQGRGTDDAFCYLKDNRWVMNPDTGDKFQTFFQSLTIASNQVTLDCQNKAFPIFFINSFGTSPLQIFATNDFGAVEITVIIQCSSFPLGLITLPFTSYPATFLPTSLGSNRIIMKGTTSFGNFQWQIQETAPAESINSVYSANSDILVDSSITGKRKLTLNSGSGANQIVKRDGSGNIAGYIPTTLTSGNILVGDGSNLAFSRTLSLNASLGTFGLSNLGVITFPASTTSTIGLLSTTDYTNILGTKTAGQSYMSPQSGSGTPSFRLIREGDLVGRYEKVGTIIPTDNFSSLSNWNTSSGGGAFTASSNELVCTGGSTFTLSNYLYNKYGMSNYEEVELRFTIRVGTISSTSYGVAAGFQTASGGNRSEQVLIHLETGNVGKIEYFGKNVTTSLGRISKNGAVLVAGDLVDVVISMNKTKISTSLYTSGTGKQINNYTYTFPQDYPNYGNPSLGYTEPVGVYNYALYACGGTHYIRNYTAISNSPKKCIVVLGDSMTDGVYATTSSNGWVEQLEKLSGLKVVRYSGSGGGLTTMNTAEILAMEPLIIINLLGTNNTNLSTSDWLIAYQAVMNPLIAAGYPVGTKLFPCLLPPRNSISVVPYNAQLTATYGTYINLYNQFTGTGVTTISPDYSDDGLHPNGLMCREMAALAYESIKSSITYIPCQNVDFQNINYQANGYVSISPGNGVSANYLADIKEKAGSVRTQMRIGQVGVNTGGYLTGNTNGLLLGGNSYLEDPGTHIATSTGTALLNLNGSTTGIQLFYTQGTTAGVGYTPVERVRVNGSGLTSFVNASSAIHVPISSITSADGLYIGVSASGNTQFSTGSELVAGVNIARSTSIAQYVQGGNGLHAFYTATGATVGSPATPTATMTIDPSGNVGIGVGLSPTSRLHVNAGTLTNGVKGNQFIATMPTTITSTSYAYLGQITSNGSSSFTNIGHGFDYLSGYTGSGATRSVNIRNQVAGTGTGLFVGIVNAGMVSSAEATTIGTNVGVYANAVGGNISIANYGQSLIPKNNGTSIGMYGQAENTGTTPTQIGGIFALGSSAVTYESGALIADNGTTTSPIFLLRDNGTKVVSVVDGGNVGIGVSAPTAILHLKAGTATASTASLKIPAGAYLSTKENGAVENDGNNFTVTNNSVRYNISNLSGSVSTTGTATTTFTVTIGQTMPNTTYKTFISATNTLSAVMYSISNKTTTTFDVVFATALTGTVAFDWELIP